MTVEYDELLPSLHPEELRAIRILVNKPDLTNNEAQMILKDITLWNAYLDFEKKGPELR